LSGRQTLNPQYWTESLQITDADLEYLFSMMLEHEQPLSSTELIERFVARRIRQEEEAWRKRLGEGTLFQPKDKYEIGQTLVFSALDFATGKVSGVRAGSSPEYGEFPVIEVEFDDGVRREFASELQSEHALNFGDDQPLMEQVLAPVDAKQIVAQYGRRIGRMIVERFGQEEDVAYAAGQWFLKSLMPEIGVGHINLAEAVLDMNGGGPVAPEDILAVLDLPKEILPSLQAFALNYTLYQDNRFDEVGAAGLVRWYLRRMEPAEVQTTPERLVYDSIPYNSDLLGEDALALEDEIGDEFSPLDEPEVEPDEVTLTLIYPHRRSGTLPLNAALSSMFPTALEASRILITLVDGETGDEHEGWVVREGRYVMGLDRFYRTHKLPVGAFVKIKRTDEPSRFIITFNSHRPRTEWIRLIIPQNGRVTFENQRRLIGAGYDDLMVLGTDDLDKVDEIWRKTRQQKRALVEIIRELLPELARLNPQNAVHAKTIYSAVNVVRRCPPGPILAALESQPEFESVGGHYWRYTREG